jgi:hypothetical protein
MHYDCRRNVARALSAAVFLSLGSGCSDDGKAAVGAAPIEDAGTDSIATQDAGPLDGGAAKAQPDGAEPYDGPTDLVGRMKAIAGMKVTEKSTSKAGYRLFRLEYEQPVDHDQPGGKHFTQRAILMHRDEAAPMVLASTGYMLFDWASEDGLEEPTELLQANQLIVEHRFFQPSRPDPAVWSDLDIQQAAADHHSLVQAFKPIYTANWISTGISKGGRTSIYHRRFYPDDVNGTIAYVAPQSFGVSDGRYLDFVADVGTDAACRDALKHVQRLTLQSRTEMESRMDASGNTFDLIGRDVVFEHAVVELPFYFWQYLGQSDCASIPGDSATPDELYAFLDKVSSIEAFYGDAMLAEFVPYYYQAATQTGYQAFAEDYLADLLQHPGTDVPATYCPDGVTVAFDPQVMQDIDAWMKASAARMLLIYGQNDPWTAGAFELGSATDSFRFVVAGGNHDANVAQLPDVQKTEALEAIARWAGVSTTSLQLPLQDKKRPSLRRR